MTNLVILAAALLSFAAYMSLDASLPAASLLTLGTSLMLLMLLLARVARSEIEKEES